MCHSYVFNEIMTCIKLIRLWTDYEVIVLAAIGLHSAMWISREGAKRLTCCFHDWLSRRSFQCQRQHHGYNIKMVRQNRRHKIGDADPSWIEGLGCIVSSHSRMWGRVRALLRRSAIFSHPLCIWRPRWGLPLELCTGAWGSEN